MTASDRHTLLNDPERWRKQADEMRSLADSSRDDVKTNLLKSAIEYDLIAEKAEKRRPSNWAINRTGSAKQP